MKKKSWIRSFLAGGGALALLAVAAAGTASADPSDGGRADPETDVVVVYKDEAKKLFGVSDRNGEGSPDAYTVDLDPETGVVWAPVFRDEVGRSKQLDSISAEEDRPNLQDRSAEDAIAIRESRYTLAQVEAALAEVERIAVTNKTAAGFWYAPSSDSILIQGQYGGEKFFPNQINGVDISFAPGKISNSVRNENTRAPFNGGAAVWGKSRSSSNSYSRCTFGIPAKNARGTKGIFTAGHCFQLNSHTFTSSTLSGQSNAGRVTHSYTYPNVDAQFISGKTYNGKIYASGGIKPVKGTYFPEAGVGKRLCFTGSTSGVRCQNSVVGYNRTVVYDSGDTVHGLIALSGYQPAAGGDSGGPVYANFGNTVRVSGIISGYYTPTVGASTTYAADWRQIASAYGASLLLG